MEVKHSHTVLLWLQVTYTLHVYYQYFTSHEKVQEIKYKYPKPYDTKCVCDKA